MKSLIIKDLYNIGHNIKSMILILLVFAFIIVPSSGPQSYIIVSGILCSMMLTTTFSFDSSSHWTSYAMAMPLTKKDLIKGKFIILLIFSAFGVITGLLFAVIGSIILHQFTFDAETIITFLFITLVGFIISDIFGSTSIPLVFRFGAENGRMLLLISFIIPLGICFIIYEFLLLIGVTINDNFMSIVLYCSPLLAIAWNYVMYIISYKTLEQTEL